MIKIRDKVKFFQFMGNDKLQLNSNVIKVFKKTYSVNDEFKLNEIIKDETDFIAHTLVKTGVKMGLWSLIGNTKYIDKIDVIFRNTPDFDTGKNSSEKWYIWSLNDHDFRDIEVTDKKLIDSEIGIVFNPLRIIDKIKTGDFNNSYPKIVMQAILQIRQHHKSQHLNTQKPKIKK